MKTSLRIGGTIHRLLTHKVITNANSQTYCLSMQVNKVAGRKGKLKIEAEQKAIREDTVPGIIQQREIKTTDDWKSVREDLFTSGKQITPITVDSIILNYCINTKNYDLGHNYMEFLKQEGIRLGLAAIGKFYKLFYLSNRDGVLEEAKENHILATYAELRKKYKILDASTSENVVHTLSITKNWKECLKLLEQIKITCEPTASVYSVTAAAAFRNNECDLGWKLLEEIVDQGHTPNPIAYLSYLGHYEGFDKLEKLFQHFRAYDIKCDAEVAKKICDVTKKLNFESRPVMITNRGICQSCKQKLQKLELNQEEFEDLKSAVFKKVIVGKNVFYKTTPSELRSFKEFVANMEKYDVVIDGLNVAYSVGTRQPPHVLSSLVSAVVKHFADQNKRILVLGRTHMRKWSKSHWSYVTQNADTFLAQELSQDDPYLLYCALNSGLNTMIVSRDLMRSHLFKLNDARLKLLFSQWLTLSQYQLQYVDNQGRAFFKLPPTYSRTAQKSQNVWHIPYDETGDGTNLSKWLCLGL